MNSTDDLYAAVGVGAVAFNYCIKDKGLTLELQEAMLVTGELYKTDK